MAKVCLAGTAVQDFIFAVREMPVRPEKYRSHALTVVGGGLAANAAVAVARLGGEAVLMVRLGDDATGRDIVEGLEAFGVDCALIRRIPGLTSPLSAIFVDAAGERLIVTYTDDALPQEPAWLPEALPDGTDAVMGDIRWEAAALRLFALARQAGCPGVLDVDSAPDSPALLQAATHVAYSHQAAREMTGREDPAAALAELAAGAPNWQAVTHGPRGTWFTADGRIEHIPAFRVEVVDTLAAGDTYHGALALALGEGMGAPEAVRFASAAAAIKCTRFGGRLGIPEREEVDRFLRGAG
ncbi:PfkB family carbohydrate kinase [Labrys monachus]|uniref:Sulfofructose kinase n=1 Tax=Labrys monachus TaxID=217067 RepID=A0ABU0FLP9_9HYPH|nr:PfkB family carbohydrate kinase [Labrys monachus]MDQ0395533.1 sulfofructose kinase [Labrys monachus]